jgi:DNA adenine methylase
MSIAAAVYGLADKFILNDLNKPLMDLWRDILENPNELVDKYESLWLGQEPNRKEFFYNIRTEFNQSKQPHHLLYLLARIVKGAVRYSADGSFNQSADNRRSGMKPQTMRKNIVAISRLLSNKTQLYSRGFLEIAVKAQRNDLVYMDPPYQGTSFTRDHRYLNGLTFDDFVDSLNILNNRGISYIISYDGITGTKKHGKLLPSSLSLTHSSIFAGRSSQATLLGSSDVTIESLYLSNALTERLNIDQAQPRNSQENTQQELAFA